MKKIKLALLCIMDVVNEDTGEKDFLKGNYYTGLVEENSLFAFDEKNHKHYIAGSKGGL